MYDNNATGITLRSIFSMCDSENCLEVYYPQVETEKKKPVNGIRSICLKETTFPINWLIRHLIGKKMIRQYNSKLPKVDARSNEGKKSFRIRLKMFLLGIINSSPMKQIDRGSADAVDQFSPDIIYTLGGDILPLTMALYFSKRYNNKPILLHYMDNWVETKYRGGGVNNIFRHILMKKLKKIQLLGTTALVISPMMAQHYNKLFDGVRHFALMNCTNINNCSTERLDKLGVVNFVYTGGLHLNRYEQLLTIETAIKQINEKQNKVYGRLLIYTGEQDKNLYEKKFCKEITSFIPFVAHDQIQKVFETADILVHVESFDMELISYTKYSISTKISEYMLSGRPILCYAPSTIAVYKYIDSNNAGVCASNPVELQTAIETCIYDQTQMIEKGRNGRAIAASNHTPIVGYKILMSAITLLLCKNLNEE